VRQIWIPHLTKMSVAEGRERFGDAFDPADPPLSNKAKEGAVRLTDDLQKAFGSPTMIFHSPKLRCMQTAAPAIERFGQHHKGGVLVVSLNTLAQPDSGDVDPNHPNARPDGLVIYGPPSTDRQWLQWFGTSFWTIRALTSAQEGTIWVFTHRPLVACARWVAQRRFCPLSNGETIDALDKSLLPYCIFKIDTNTIWKEVPRE